jgi:2-oxo-4-hydroxy-4-carboxy-5-ureidoimidazoline decarboxylase
VNTSKPYSREEFLRNFADLFEHSPWIAESAFDLLKQKCQSLNLPEIDELDEMFRITIMNATPALQMELLNAHPELACSIADSNHLTVDSQNEQFKAGLQACSPEEFEEFRQLNQNYRDKFGFPFIVAVKGMKRAEILALFRQRIEGDVTEESTTALRQVCRIGRIRLESKLND